VVGEFTTGGKDRGGGWPGTGLLGSGFAGAGICRVCQCARRWGLVCHGTHQKATKLDAPAPTWLSLARSCKGVGWGVGGVGFGWRRPGGVRQQRKKCSGNTRYNPKFYLRESLAITPKPSRARLATVTTCSIPCNLLHRANRPTEWGGGEMWRGSGGGEGGGVDQNRLNVQIGSPANGALCGNMFTGLYGGWWSFR